ncbi:MAG: glycolate oxidase subunit GlcF [Gammaproteobacteria bacterium]|jgi:glycolate oxidase iron-sulfur subunit
MRTDFVKPYTDSDEGKIANDILRRCVHCGFCNATCPTYQLLGDELDGPRGRIYLIKQMLEGKEVSEKSQLHLDRCLICRACETTCPSGVEYSRLLEIGQQLVETKVPRPAWQRLKRSVFNKVLPNVQRFRWLLALGRWFKYVVPTHLESGLEVKKPRLSFPASTHAKKMLLLKGCVQSQLAPDINRAAAQVADRLGITLVEEPENNTCCGAVSQHLAKTDDAAQTMRRNIDRWWPLIEEGIEAIVVTASGCAPHVKNYGYLLRSDARYGEKARRVSALAKDISEVVTSVDAGALKVLAEPQKLAFQSPCTLQHGQQLDGVVESLLQRLGYELVPVADAHLCCGAAGTYALLQTAISEQLLINKLTALEKHQPQMIATANIGCLKHLQRDASVPVKHWIELVAENNL